MAKEPSKTQRCGTCRFGHEHPEVSADRVACCRYPGTIRPDNHRELATIPVMLKASWCGEWAPADPQTVPEGAATLARLVLLGDLTAARALADKLKES